MKKSFLDAIIHDKNSESFLMKKLYHYLKVQKENIYQESSSQLYVGEWDLTLFTCRNIDMKYRTVIRLKRV